jgi:hypothetical protein
MSDNNPFTYIDSVSYTKKNLMRGSNNDELAEKGYKPYLANRALSYHQDAILYANELNRRPQLDNKLQYEFLLNSLRKRKRYAKWQKKVDDVSLELIMEYFGYGRAEALQAMKVLTDEQLAMIEVALDKGGKG